MKKWLIVACFIALFSCTHRQTTTRISKPPDLYPDASTVEVISLKVYPNEVSVRETITIVAEIKNAGSEAYMFPITLTVDGKDIKKRNVEIEAQSSKPVTFQLVKDKPGTYQISIGNQASSIQIREKPFPSTDRARIAIFKHEKTGADIVTILPLLGELSFDDIWADYKFINNRDNFFEKSGERKFDVLFFAGGESDLYFAKTAILGFKSAGDGIDESGCRNIIEFILQGGSCIASCISGPAMFTDKLIWIGIGLEEANSGKRWTPRTNLQRGHMARLYGVEPLFKGVIRGPQETNQPYPQTHFLPIRLNTDHPLVKRTHLPETAYLCTIGSGSLIPDKDQPMEVLGWFPNGTAAMGIVKCGEGHLYLISPHPSMTMDNMREHIKNQTMGTHARRWGWDEERVKMAQEIFEAEGDPDGPDPDYILMKAILQDAWERSIGRGK